MLNSSFVLSALLLAVFTSSGFGQVGRPASIPAVAGGSEVQPACAVFQTSPYRASIYRTGGTGTIDISSEGCAWTATSNASWLTFLSPVSGNGAGTITYQVDANTGAGRTATITIANVPIVITQPNDLAPENLTIYTTDLKQNRIARFSDLAGTHWETGPTIPALSLNYPWHFCLDSLGRIYIAERENNRIVRMDDLAGHGWKTFGGGAGHPFIQPRSVSLDALGRIYIIDSSGRAIVRIDDMDGAGWITLQPPFGVDYFNGAKTLVFDTLGRFYVSDTDNYRVVRFDDVNLTNWTTFGSHGSGTGQFNRPEGLALDSAGRIYITDNENNRIVRIDNMTGAGWTTFGTGTPGSGMNQVSEPHDIAISSSGRIYIADTGNSRVVRIDDMAGAGWTAFGTQPNATADAVGQYQFEAVKGIRLGAPLPACSSTLSTITTSAALTGGTGAVTVAISPGCGWTATSNDAWITIPAGGSGSGDGAVNYSVAANSGAPRIGTLTIAGRTFTVTQGSAPPAFTTQPANRSVTLGLYARFTVAAIGPPAPIYQWQQSLNGGVSWTGLTEADTTPYFGVGTPTLSVGSVTVDLQGSQYRAVATNAAGSTPSSAATLTVYQPFTDSVLTPGITLIRVVHITELRARIDAQRTRYGLSPFQWTDEPLPPGTTATAVQITELRTALQEASTQAGQPPLIFTDSPIVPGNTIVRAVHIQELRDAVVSLEGL
jgi:sugar lactone lactonase YvrE